MPCRRVPLREGRGTKKGGWGGVGNGLVGCVQKNAKTPCIRCKIAVTHKTPRGVQGTEQTPSDKTCQSREGASREGGATEKARTTTISTPGALVSVLCACSREAACWEASPHMFWVIAATECYIGYSIHHPQDRRAEDPRCSKIRTDYCKTRMGLECVVEVSTYMHSWPTEVARELGR